MKEPKISTEVWDELEREAPEKWLVFLKRLKKENRLSSLNNMKEEYRFHRLMNDAEPGIDFLLNVKVTQVTFYVATEINKGDLMAEAKGEYKGRPVVIAEEGNQQLYRVTEGTDEEVEVCLPMKLFTSEEEEEVKAILLEFLQELSREADKCISEAPDALPNGEVNTGEPPDLNVQK